MKTSLLYYSAMRQFQAVTAAIAALRARTLILDGEVAVFDDQFVSLLGYLRPRDPSRLLKPRMFVAFDCLRDLSQHSGNLRGLRSRGGAGARAPLSSAPLSTRSLSASARSANSSQRRGLGGQRMYSAAKL